MYSKYRYNKIKHVVVVALYAAILLAEAGEFFVSNSDKIQIDHAVQTHQVQEIPEHVPEKNESSSLWIRKICKQKLTFSEDGSHSVKTICLIVSSLKSGSDANQSEVNHKFVG